MTTQACYITTQRPKLQPTSSKVQQTTQFEINLVSATTKQLHSSQKNWKFNPIPFSTSNHSPISQTSVKAPIYTKTTKSPPILIPYNKPPTSLIAISTSTPPITHKTQTFTDKWQFKHLIKPIAHNKNKAFMPLTNPIIQIHKILRSIIWPYNQNSQNPPENNEPKQTLNSDKLPLEPRFTESFKKQKRKKNQKMQKNPNFSTKTETLTHTS
jgi:hypothetical protein